MGERFFCKKDTKILLKKTFPLQVKFSSHNNTAYFKIIQIATGEYGIVLVTERIVKCMVDPFSGHKMGVCHKFKLETSMKKRDDILCAASDVDYTNLL